MPLSPRPCPSPHHGMSGLVRAVAHLAIRFYQLTFSAFVGRQCRHLPTCSDYTDEAIQRHGFWAGGWMGAARIARCRPFGTSGYDPVPQTIVGGCQMVASHGATAIGMATHRAKAPGTKTRPHREERLNAAFRIRSVGGS